MLYDQLQEAHPGYTNILKLLLLHDQKVEDYLTRKYGVDTLENILATAKYNDYIDKKRDDGTALSKLAQKRNTLMEMYLQHFAPLVSAYGYATAIKYDEMATKYLKSILKLD